ncbi:ATP-binding cassette domain-containing protein [Winogradskyella psychrotolerans]|uniref:ATP-binding cassette domain-containing protein n=1 Tax=Winogradskyella psychrotolerans TaxID=1344585 RepID=UPI001C06502F|nr:ATP-binding cassette domain-containing protein [Winogradskyella psychrotolerans]MBU2927088.1 ATP-binding cassette domain-containing protein [Winogradskyella psychrotolerans]
MTPSHQHYAIEDTTRSPQAHWLSNLLNGAYKLPEIEGKRGALFSNSVLEKYIEEEEKHDNFELTSGLNRSLRTLSSGEQKKALLSHLLQQKPDFIVLNNPYEALDKASVSVLKEELMSLSKSMPIVLIFNRQDDLLPVMTHVITFENTELKAVVPIENYSFKRSTFVFDKVIPSAITTYSNIPEVLIELKNVNVHYEDRSILKDINWTIKKKEFWHLIGPNGSGKTTLLSMIYGNNTKGYGQELYLFGQKKGSGESVWDIKQKIGYISPAMLELFKRSYTVEQMIISGFYDSIGLYQTPSTAQIRAAAQWMNVLNLSDQKNTSFLKLSPAVQRLILIARAMIKHPPLLILDEPLINVDDEGRALISTLINKIAKESETSILFVAHRDEANIHPDFIYELQPSSNGSVGIPK